MPRVLGVLKVLGVGNQKPEVGRQKLEAGKQETEARKQKLEDGSWKKACYNSYESALIYL